MGLPCHEPIAEVRLRIRRTLAVLFRLGDVVELRAFTGRWTKSGYFDNYDVLADEAFKLDGQGWQVYVTLNPVKEALLAEPLTVPRIDLQSPRRTATSRAEMAAA